jgi:hypothetical protein
MKAGVNDAYGIATSKKCKSRDFIKGKGTVVGYVVQLRRYYHHRKRNSEYLLNKKKIQQTPISD